MSTRMRELIRTVRACKTAADERAVIAKECAAIRTALKDEDNPHRHRNVAKLLYINMLGYSTHFGQMECIKLIASQKFAEKRVGYLGLMTLLDETQEVLMLVTNSLQSDLMHSNQYVAGLALCTLGNIASTDIARDLASTVEKLLGSSDAYLRKKAALCAIRIFRKVPELLESFVDRVNSLLTDRNHGVLLTGTTLLIEMCKVSKRARKKFKRSVGTLVRMLKTLTSSGYSPEHDVGGVTDPFLQVKVLRALEILGRDDADASDEMSDILAQVATNTEVTRNAGNAILYQCVRTIMNIDSEGGLRLLAVNILGRFLMNRDNNIRYVALHTLAQIAHDDIQAVQRHRSTIVDCLKDPDISIRRRALELVYLLVNQNNVKPLVRELVNYLSVADSLFKPDLCTRVCGVVERNAPSREWYIDTMAELFDIAGHHMSPDIVSRFIRIVGRDRTLHAYAVHRIYGVLNKGTSRALVEAGVWVIGEYADLLHADLPEGAQGTFGRAVSAEDIVAAVKRVLCIPGLPSSSAEMAVTALAKIAVRLPAVKDNVCKIVAHHRSSVDLELQQRAVEYAEILSKRKIADMVLERMPDAEGTASTAITPAATATAGDAASASGADPAAAPQPEEPEVQRAGNLLDDLLSLGMDTPAQPVTATVPSAGGSSMLDDLLGGPIAAAPMPVASSGAGGSDALLDLLGGGDAPAPAPAPAAEPALAYGQQPQQTSQSPSLPLLDDQSGFKIDLMLGKDAGNPAVSEITAIFSNSGATAISAINFQVAVPKYIQLQLLPPSATALAPSSTATQLVRLNNTMHGQKQVLIRYRVSYSRDGQPVTHQGQSPPFPEGF